MYLSGETKLVTAQSKRKRQARKGLIPLRCGVYKRVESLGYDPKPGDLGVGRMKRGENYVEVR